MILFCLILICDGVVKAQIFRHSVIPAQAGIQSFQYVLDSRLRGNDGAGSFYEIVIFNKKIKDTDHKTLF